MPAIVLVLALLPAGAVAQAEGSWVVAGEVGRYEIHERAGDAPAGVVLAAFGGRQWGPLRLKLAVAEGFGDDAFTSFEPGLELVVVPTLPLNVVAGAGGGLMWEHAGTLSLPYYALLGLEIAITDRSRIRGVVRRGSHANTGDPGTFRGPHMVSVGIAWRL